MAQINGAVECRLDDEWYEVVTVGALLLQHWDLNGCLFGVDNYGGFAPLFPDRGVPPDCSAAVARLTEDLDANEAHASWVSWRELSEVSWSESATARDRRVTQSVIGDDGAVTVVTKWLHKAGFEWVEQVLGEDPTVELTCGDFRFCRAILKRSDALVDTEFPLVMRLMECLAGRFGVERVRLIVWFD